MGQVNPFGRVLTSNHAGSLHEQIVGQHTHGTTWGSSIDIEGLAIFADHLQAHRVERLSTGMQLWQTSACTTTHHDGMCLDVGIAQHAPQGKVQRGTVGRTFLLQFSFPDGKDAEVAVPREVVLQQFPKPGSALLHREGVGQIEGGLFLCQWIVHLVELAEVLILHQHAIDLLPRRREASAPAVGEFYPVEVMHHLCQEVLHAIYPVIILDHGQTGAEELVHASLYRSRTLRCRECECRDVNILVEQDDAAVFDMEIEPCRNHQGIFGVEDGHLLALGIPVADGEIIVAVAFVFIFDHRPHLDIGDREFHLAILVVDAFLALQVIGHLRTHHLPAFQVVRCGLDARHAFIARLLRRVVEDHLHIALLDAFRLKDFDALLYLIDDSEIVTRLFKLRFRVAI